MRAWLGPALAIGAALLAVAGIAFGLRCGMMSTSGTCTSANVCTSTTQCVGFVHPFLVPFLLVSLLASATSARRLRLVTIALGLFATALGTLFGLSLGLWGLAGGALVVLAGLATPGPAREGPLLLGAVVAALAPLPALLLAVRFAPEMALAFPFVVVLLPALAWCAFAAATRRRSAA